VYYGHVNPTGDFVEKLSLQHAEVGVVVIERYNTLVRKISHSPSLTSSCGLFDGADDDAVRIAFGKDPVDTATFKITWRVRLAFCT